MKTPTSLTEFLILILMTALSLLFGGLVYFVKRYIDSSDKNNIEVDGKLKKINDTIKDQSVEIRSAVQKVNDSATSIERSALQFQREIHKELHEAQKSTTQMKADVDKISGAVAGLQDIVIKHQHSLSLGAKAMVQTREEINQIKTVITKIGPDAVLVGQKKPDKG